MLRTTCGLRNTYLTHSQASAPITVIRSGPKFWSQPERMVRYKLLYYTLGIDQLPLRRTAVIAADRARQMKCKPILFGGDATGYKKSRHAQLQTWYRRIQYQEYYLQHLFTRHAWSLLRMYPANHTKLAGKADDGYTGYDAVPYHRYNRSPSAFPARELYERRK
jgi:hypothetical protein